MIPNNYRAHAIFDNGDGTFYSLEILAWDSSGWALVADIATGQLVRADQRTGFVSLYVTEYRFASQAALNSIFMVENFS